MAVGEHLGEFIANALAGDDLDFGGVALDRGQCFRLDFVFKAGRETNRAQHTKLVFRESRCGSPMARMMPASRSFLRR